MTTLYLVATAKPWEISAGFFKATSMKGSAATDGGSWNG